MELQLACNAIRAVHAIQCLKNRVGLLHAFCLGLGTRLACSAVFLNVKHSSVNARRTSFLRRFSLSHCCLLGVVEAQSAKHAEESQAGGATFEHLAVKIHLTHRSAMQPNMMPEQVNTVVE